MYKQNTQRTNLLLEQFQLEELEERMEFRDWASVKNCGLLSTDVWTEIKTVVDNPVDDENPVVTTIGQCMPGDRP